MKTVLLFFFLGLTMIVLSPLGLVSLLLNFVRLRRPMAFLIYKIAQGWAQFVILCAGCSMTVTGREQIPKEGGVCFVSNHGSIFDIVLHLAYIGRPIGFIAKKELIYIPLLNMWISLLGGLFIDRKNVRNAVRTINKGIARIKAGSGMIIFPEGHRSRNQGLLPFHSGSFKLATQAGAPIIPVAIIGSYDVFERHYLVNAVPVEIHFGEPVPTAGLSAEDRRQRLSDRVYRIIDAALKAGHREGFSKSPSENADP
ncbi:MAG: 1-acyl-sn-glycerol-3-phosphate acyltransferase [Spirochaetaceae bacterium]|nr:1-acyl-sn-glycerol-3-phosphate acyltransferase [Spirochaetaceae bacterium]